MSALPRFLKRPFEIGAIAPSSRRFACRVVEVAGVRNCDRVIELGAGNGVITERIIDALPPGSRFLAIERCSDLSHRLARRIGRSLVVCDCASRIESRAREHGIEGADCVVSALPWSNLAPALRSSIVEGVRRTLSPGGMFVTICCYGLHWLPAGRHLRQLLENSFSGITRSPVEIANLPPAFVYVCRR
jgi:Phospholipid N-methyltransferase